MVKYSYPFHKAIIVILLEQIFIIGLLCLSISQFGGSGLAASYWV